MRNRTATVIALAALLVAAGGPAASAQDQITNGRVERVASAGRPDYQVRALAGRSSEPVWIGYVMPAVAGERVMFWLGQSKDPRALEFFAEILRK